MSYRSSASRQRLDGFLHLLCVGLTLVTSSKSQSQAPLDQPPLPPALEKRVKEAIDRGVNFLGRSQNPNGSFGDGVPIKKVKMSYPVGYTALPALALLECGVPRKDASIKQAADLVRKLAPSRTLTYELACAIMFLDRLGDKDDVPLIRSLALRLAAGQGTLGGWGYNCPSLTAAEEKKLIATLRERRLRMWSNTSLRPIRR